MKVPSLISKSHTNKKMNFYIFHEIWKNKQFFLYCKNIFIHYFSIGIWKTKKPKGTAVGSGIHSRTWITSRGSKRNLKTLLQVTYFFVRITIKIWKSREIGETPFFARSHCIVTRGSVSLLCATTPHPSCFSKS